MRRSTPSQASTSGRQGRVSPEKTTLSPLKSNLYPTEPLRMWITGKDEIRTPLRSYTVEVVSKGTSLTSMRAPDCRGGR